MYTFKFICTAILITLTSFSNISLAQEAGHDKSNSSNMPLTHNNGKGDSQKEWPQQLRFLGGQNGGQWFALGNAIAKTFTDKLTPTYSRLGGGLANLIGINENKGDIAFSVSSLLNVADSGEAEFKDLKFDNVLLLANIYPQVVYFVIHKEFAEKHNIHDVESLLKLKYPVRFASLKPGTSSDFVLNLLLKYAYNTSFDDLKKSGWEFIFSDYSEIADIFTEGDIDCFGYAAGTSVPLIKTIEKHVNIAILPISQSTLDLLSKKFKTTTYTIEPGTYTSVTKPTKTLGDYTIIVVNKNLPNNLVYSINETLWKNKQTIAGNIIDFYSLSPELAISSKHKLHPSSLEFWNSIK